MIDYPFWHVQLRNTYDYCPPLILFALYPNPNPFKFFLNSLTPVLY